MLQCIRWQRVVAVQFCALAVLVIMARVLWRTSRRPSCVRVLRAIPRGWRPFLLTASRVVEHSLLLTAATAEVCANISNLQASGVRLGAIFKLCEPSHRLCSAVAAHFCAGLQGSTHRWPFGKAEEAALRQVVQLHAREPRRFS